MAARISASSATARISSALAALAGSSSAARAAASPSRYALCTARRSCSSSFCRACTGGAAPAGTACVSRGAPAVQSKVRNEFGCLMIRPAAMILNFFFQKPGPQELRRGSRIFVNFLPQVLGQGLVFCSREHRGLERVDQLLFLRYRVQGHAGSFSGELARSWWRQRWQRLGCLGMATATPQREPNTCADDEDYAGRPTRDKLRILLQVPRRFIRPCRRAVLGPRLGGPILSNGSVKGHGFHRKLIAAGCIDPRDVGDQILDHADLFRRRRDKRAGITGALFHPLHFLIQQHGDSDALYLSAWMFHMADRSAGLVIRVLGAAGGAAGATRGGRRGGGRSC